MPRRLPAALCLLLALTAVSWGAPPDKEMHQAPGAIDAARAAGADSYAAEELRRASDALKRAEDAAAERDYRLALSQALDSREFAQNAAKLAADQKAEVRSDAERMLAQVTSAIAVAAARLATDSSRTRPPAVAALDQAVQNARAAVDEAGKALASEDYLEARRRLQGVRDSVLKAQQAVPAPPPPRPVRRGR